MREKLEQLQETRLTIKATFVRFGEKTAYKGPPLKTLLFSDIVDVKNDVNLCDHIWMTSGKWSKNILHPGQIVQFDARVKPYLKGYLGNDVERMMDKPVEIDYKFSHPTNVRVDEV